ncbi:hypothetical protein BS50DRAFT_110205 [Corynespora cassiicola Philippines]|uniref:Uncharacterized protein n=1 Tax=Corynespora cassiicola Philippines TaxID=1448308 RepID=A0A2T2NDA0_CORCC|nr:hypothetical protein BS50DRAFT_110205 [Corynespora cassiicola Philippines]
MPRGRRRHCIWCGRRKIRHGCRRASESITRMCASATCQVQNHSRGLPVTFTAGEEEGGGASRWNYWVDRNRPTMRSCDLWYEVGFFLWLEAVEHAGWLPPSSSYSTAQDNKLHGNCARPGNCRMPPPSTTCHIRSESSDEMCSSHGNREKKSYDWLRAVHDTDSKKKKTRQRLSGRILRLGAVSQCWGNWDFFDPVEVPILEDIREMRLRKMHRLHHMTISWSRIRLLKMSCRHHLTMYRK